MGLKRDKIPSSQTTDKIRKKGDWASLHIERQAANLPDNRLEHRIAIRIATDSL